MDSRWRSRLERRGGGGSCMDRGCEYRGGREGGREVRKEVGSFFNIYIGFLFSLCVCVSVC
jgi:hypothetical protein